MKHLGDITKLTGGDVPTANVVIGGSPCQDLSIAGGKRAGLAGERSGLFLEQIRLIKEMRRKMRRTDEQAATYDRDSWSGKTCQARSPQTAERTSGVSSKRQSGSRTKAPLFLDLRKGNGEQAAVSWETDSPSLGVYSTHSFGECPNVAVESRLSQILEETPHQKYSLSAKACRGILRRAERRGKALPETLRAALESQIAAEAPEV